MGTYGSSILYNEGLKQFYLRRNSDGALTSTVAVGRTIKVDTKMPVFSDSAEGGLVLTSGSKMFADKLNVFISDEHLANVRVNGKPAGNISSGMLLELDSENGVKTFEITAEDEAGNTESLTITVYALWLIDKVIPEKNNLPLSVNESYTLDGGSWTVEGDSTVYSGGFTVYVNSDGVYYFIKVN